PDPVRKHLTRDTPLAARINPILRKLIRERKITPARLSRDFVLKELRGAEADLHEARESVEAGKFKWATVQGYYSAFHSARALLYNKGFREKSHSTASGTEGALRPRPAKIHT
ncbi:MAG TPA: HEPN domain-containing protein, partial [Candidatus Bathyarchaeia archaeon]